MNPQVHLIAAGNRLVSLENLCEDEWTELEKEFTRLRGRSGRTEGDPRSGEASLKSV